MSVPLQLTDLQRLIVETVAANERTSWQLKFYDTVTDALMGCRPITDQDVHRAVRRGLEAAEGQAYDDYYSDCT